MVSPYDVLDVDPDATEEEVKLAYRERIKETHPDQGGNQREFKLVQNAYEEITGNERDDNKSAGGSRTQSETRHNTPKATCSNCGTNIYDLSNGTLGPEDSIFCDGCIVNVDCTDCGKNLTLTFTQYSDVSGSPVCKSCVEKRKQESSTNERGGKKESARQCSYCGSGVNFPYKEGDSLICEDCMINTTCLKCGKELTLTPETWQSVDGSPVCTDCDGSSQSQNDGVVETIMTLVLWSVIIVSSVYLFTDFNPTLVITIPSNLTNTLREVGRAVVGPGLLILIWVVLKDR